MKPMKTTLIVHTMPLHLPKKILCAALSTLCVSAYCNLRIINNQMPLTHVCKEKYLREGCNLFNV